jgi:L-amino acid N-acyltransferase YncA
VEAVVVDEREELDLTIRSVRLDDAEAVVGILNPIIEAGVYTVFDAPLTAQDERDYIAAFPPRRLFFVVERLSTREVIAFQTIDPFADYTGAFDHVGILGTYVDLSERRKGIGSHLARVSFAAARQKGYEKIFTYVRADNQASLSFHLSLGFQIIGTAHRQAKLNGRYVDEVLIEKFL